MLNDEIKIDIGCGQGQKEGFIGIDLHEPTKGWENVDITCDVRDGIPFEDNSVDEIYSAHFFEHLAKAEVVPVLRECNRVLKKNGKIEIIVPDLPRVLNNFIENLDYGWGIDSVFGGQAHDGEFHKTGYWDELLYTLLSQNFYTNITINEMTGWNQPCLQAVAYKI